MNRQFGALRGLAIVLVVLHHSIESATWVPHEASYPATDGMLSLILSTLYQLGVLAVPMFLFISGSFFAYAASGNRTKLSWKPVRSSLKHILWPYLIWSIVFYALVYAWKGEQYSVLGYATKLLVGYPFNFVPLLVFWYIASPVLVRFSDRYGWAFIAVLGYLPTGAVQSGVPRCVWLSVSVLDARARAQNSRRHHGAVGDLLPIGTHLWSQGEERQSRACQMQVDTAKYYNRDAGAQPFWMPKAILHAPLAGIVAATAFVLYMPSIKREAIPLYRQLEEVGKKSYGLYLMNLIVLSLVLIIIGVIAPGLFSLDILVQPILFIAALSHTDDHHGQGGPVAVAPHLSLFIWMRLEMTISTNSISNGTKWPRYLIILGASWFSGIVGRRSLVTGYGFKLRSFGRMLLNTTLAVANAEASLDTALASIGISCFCTIRWVRT